MSGAFLQESQQLFDIIVAQLVLVLDARPRQDVCDFLQERE
jgi:hypothetical protein